MTVGDKIRLARKHAEYSVPMAAKALGMTPYKFQLYEHNDMLLPPAMTVKLAKLFGVNVSELCDDDGAFLHIPVYLDKGAVAPQKKAFGSGFEIIAHRSGYIPAGHCVSFDTGIRLELSEDYCAALVSAPVLSHKYGITAEGGCDSSGRVIALLSNCSDAGFFYQAGDKIGEMLILPCQLSSLEIQ